ncbi:hypothetical protein KKG22_04950 [Patescibacteria group bacterium]|nr:hypothetical protein [Patescibacteria group bacterium]MBU1721683.1 hypothetical protein [Patescibacteria group bacterium]MBU1900992.1 hypothetical protein [Patescibacteria group bacterium]
MCDKTKEFGINIIIGTNHSDFVPKGAREIIEEFLRKFLQYLNIPAEHIYTVILGQMTKGTGTKINRGIHVIRFTNGKQITLEFQATNGKGKGDGNGGAREYHFTPPQHLLDSSGKTPEELFNIMRKIAKGEETPTERVTRLLREKQQAQRERQQAQSELAKIKREIGKLEQRAENAELTVLSRDEEIGEVAGNIATSLHEFIINTYGGELPQEIMTLVKEQL